MLPCTNFLAQYCEKLCQTIRGGYNIRETTYSSRIHENPKVRDILENWIWLGIFERLRGFDDEIALKFTLNAS